MLALIAAVGISMWVAIAAKLVVAAVFDASLFCLLPYLVADEGRTPTHRIHKEPHITRRNVLITGASSGIGKATAGLLAREGFRVFGTSRRRHPDEAGVEMLELDVRSDQSVAHCVAEMLSRAGGIDVLINNAGIDVSIAEETTMDEIREVFETNFFGVVRMTRAVLPHMRARRQGRIINVGSLAAWVGEPGEAFYSASKRALSGFTEALRHEVWPLGIDVSLVEPGAFKTTIIRPGSPPKGTITDYDAVRSAAWRTLIDSLRRGGDPRRAAEVMLTVASDRSPRFRYAAGFEAVAIPFLKVLLPQRLFDYLLRRGFGLRRQDRHPGSASEPPHTTRAE